MELSKGQIEVLKGFDTLGHVDDNALTAYVHHMSSRTMSSSGIRTRRSELVDKGAVTIVGTHLLKSGRQAAIHGLTRRGCSALAAAKRSEAKAARKSAKVTV